MSEEQLQMFISDVLDELDRRFEESQKEMKNSPNDSFISGRALAYREIKEVIKTRMDIYDIAEDKIL